MTRAGRAVAGVAGSVLVHGGLVLALLLFAAHAPPPPKKDRVVELAVVSTPPPKPEPPPPPPPPPKPKRVKPARLHTRPPPRPRKAPKTPPPPPPSNAPPPKDPPKQPVPLITGISMSSTVGPGQSDLKVGVGNTVYGTPGKVAADPSKVQGYQGSERYVPPTQVATLPEVAHEVKAAYPPAARQAGIEGQVRLKLRISAEGKVVSVKVLSGLGHGLDAAAAQAMRRFRFKPATMNGAAVSTDIIYVYTFVLD